MLHVRISAVNYKLQKQGSDYVKYFNDNAIAYLFHSILLLWLSRINDRVPYMILLILSYNSYQYIISNVYQHTTTTKPIMINVWWSNWRMSLPSKDFFVQIGCLISYLIWGNVIWIDIKKKRMTIIKVWLNKSWNSR